MKYAKPRSGLPGEQGVSTDMGDKKPKKNSSGSSDAHKAKQSKDAAARPPEAPRGNDKGKKK